uniref:Kinesin-like protein n=1 Tax=Kalanchoe fedtschenkoi TaxID=63787 RepID=A0A7N0T4M1_KALFE
MDGGPPIDQNRSYPVSHKILQLASTVKVLKMEHSLLAAEVKNWSPELVIDPEVHTKLHLLVNDYQQSKNKCLLLEKKYMQESNERKRLYNEVIELKGNIRVFCRCRPLHPSEVGNGSTAVIEYDSCPENELQVICSDSSKKLFKFDHVFKPEDSQEAVFSQTSPVVTSVMDGYNVCIFAYGQTGTGKTFTMEGTSENRGVNYRTLEELFYLSYQRSGIMTYELYVSMLEVYNEKIRDLLVENSNESLKKLEIKQTPEGTQEVPGLVEARVFSTDEVWELLMTGSRARSVGATNANELSSRSHCLLRVTVKGENLINGQRTKSHLWLVDLAGSERVGKIEVEGERLKESQFINKSLSALGDVISALASKTPHVPYRNSKLTHLLQSSLGGDCKTLMIVQVSPAATDLGETLCSLNFASRVRGIEAGPARKQADMNELFKYKQLAEKQKHDEKEIQKLQDRIQSLQLRLGVREISCRGHQDKVRELEEQLKEERRIRLKQETKSFAAASVPYSATSFRKHAQAAATEKKPPLAPSKMRMPLRKIPNFEPPPSALPPYRNSSRPSMIPSYVSDKENLQKTDYARKSLLQPRRRVSMAVRNPPPASQPQVFKRRVSVATFTPVPRSVEMMTPAVKSSSSKFMGSPPTQAGSWKPKHPTVVALQRKTLVWSPLKLRGMKSFRKPSMMPLRSISNQMK